MSTQMPTTRQTPTDQDRRFIPGRVTVRSKTVDAEGRAAEPTEVIDGYGALFGSETVIGSWFREVLDPHCFDAAIGRDDVRGLFNHDPNLILGRNKAGTMELVVDASGLRYVITPPDTSYAKDLRESIRRGDVSGSSFAFRATKEMWTEPPAGSQELPLRTILECELFDVSPVTYPAYEETSVSVQARSKAESLSAEEVARVAARGKADAGAADARARALRLQLDLATL